MTLTNEAPTPFSFTGKKAEVVKRLGTVIEVGEINPTLLRVAPTNNRTVDIPDKEKASMDKSIAINGVAEHITINENNEIVSGQLRWKSALRNNLASVPFIRMKFNDAYSERIYSMLQDDKKHKLEALDKYLFIQKARNEDKKSYEQIANDLGEMDVNYVRSWAHYQNVPKVIAENKEACDNFMKFTGKKRNAVRSVLDKPAYANDIVKSLDFISFATDAPLRELEQARKDAALGTPINSKARKARLKEKTILIEVKIPKSTDVSFRRALKEKNDDYVIVIEKLIIGYTRNLFDISSIQ